MYRLYQNAMNCRINPLNEDEVCCFSDGGVRGGCCWIPGDIIPDECPRKKELTKYQAAEAAFFDDDNRLHDRETYEDWCKKDDRDIYPNPNVDEIPF